MAGMAAMAATVMHRIAHACRGHPSCSQRIGNLPESLVLYDNLNRLDTLRFCAAHRHGGSAPQRHARPPDVAVSASRTRSRA